MSVKNGRDYIYLIWKNPQTRRQYIVAELSKNGVYEFNYGHEINEALNNGFEPLISFEDVDKTYQSDILFPVFSSRLPDKKRQNIKDILDKYNLSEYDAYKLLKRSGARLPIDNLEFIDPIIFNSELKEVKRIFYLAGPRHYIGCDGIDCSLSICLERGEQLFAVLEPENKFDSKAIRLVNSEKQLIGYIPKYYNTEIFDFIKEGYKINYIVFEVLKENNCNECIKIEMTIEFA